MEQGTLYAFSSEFFNNVIAIQEFCNSIIPDINKEITIELKREKSRVYVDLLENIVKNIQIEEGKAICIISQCNLLRFVFYPNGDRSLLFAILKKLKQIDSINLERPYSWAFHYISGVSLFDHYQITKSTSQYSIKNLDILFQAKKHFSILLQELFKGGLEIDKSNTQNFIFYWSLSIAELNRWVEPLFILDQIEKTAPDFRENALGAKALILDSYSEKTCCTIGPLLPYKLIILAKTSLGGTTKENPNFETLNLIKTKAEDLLVKNNIQLDSLEKLVEEAENEFHGHNLYQKFIITRHLTLSEHALYCNCKNAAKDDLKIKSNHKHTEIGWVNQFQLILEQLKISFDKARQSFFRATQKKGVSLLYKSTVKNEFNDGRLVLSAKSYQLIDAFKECFSILDKIALGFDLAFELKTKDIHFVRYFDTSKVKSLIDSEDNNLYMISLYSIAQDLDKNSNFSAFPEFKEWRNAAEHDLLIPIKPDANIDDLKNKYPIVRCFVDYAELESKTFYMLQLCKSAIFTYTFLIRKASISKAKMIDQG